jgi:putative spermidine/putrescine transport system substrate-binding protein
MSPRLVLLATLVVLTLCQACRPAQTTTEFSPAELTRTAWADVVNKARGATVHYAMWAGDEARNRFYQGPVADSLRRELDLTLRIVPTGDTTDLISKLVNEKAAGLRRGSVDLVWINGANFRTAKQGRLLWGPFAPALPNLRYFDQQATARDFGTSTDGLEAPYEQAQFVLAYDSARTPQPPHSLGDLQAWIHAHPGRFTYPAIPDFTGSAFARHFLLHAGGAAPALFTEPFDEGLYARASKIVFALLREMKPSLWRRGETFPATVADLDRLFVNGEIDFSMNYSPTFASEKIARGEFPATVRTLVLDEGTISNYSFLAIPFNAPNPAAALVVINEFMSPAHALARAGAVGGLFPLRLDHMSASERAAAEALPVGPATLPLATLARRRVEEAQAEYVDRFERDWRAEVLVR